MQIILNKTNNDIEEEVFEKVCDLKVVGNIKQNNVTQDESYERILETLDYIPKKSFIDKINSAKYKLSNLIKNNALSNAQ